MISGSLAIVPEGPLAFDGVNYLYSDGEGYYIDSLARKFEHVYIFGYAFRDDSSWYEGASTYQFKEKNISVIELPFSEEAGVLGKVFQIIRVKWTFVKHRNKFEYLYVFFPGYPAIAAYVVAKIFRKPLFSYAASDWSVEESNLIFKWQSKLLIPLKNILSQVSLFAEKRLVRDALFTLTASKDGIQRYQPISNRIYKTVPRIDFSKLTIRIREETCVKRPINLLFVGGIYERKGVFDLAEAFKKIIKNEDCTLTIVGDGSDIQDLRESLHDSLENGVVKIVGHVAYGPSLMEYYANADIFVFPSLGEGFPRVLYEAMANCLPIVSSDVGGISREVPHEVRGILISPSDPDGLIEAVMRLIKDHDLRRSIIKNNGEYMSKFLENSDAGRQIETLFYKYVKEGIHARD